MNACVYAFLIINSAEKSIEKHIRLTYAHNNCKDVSDKNQRMYYEYITVKLLCPLKIL